MTFDRHGSFAVETEGPYHCSVLSSPLCHYRVHIEAHGPDLLDSRGFLFDQLDCPNYFASIRRTSLSCERLAQKALFDLYRQITSENPHLHIAAMRVAIEPQGDPTSLDPYELGVEADLADFPQLREEVPLHTDGIQ